MDKLETMRVFIEVAEYQSFVEASRKLDMSAPAVTRSIARLESSLGVRLFNRTTRHVRLTDSGQRFLDDSKRILEFMEDAEAAASGSYVEPKGVLSVTAPVLFGQKHIVPIIAEYLKQNPAVSVKAIFFDRVANIIEEGLDVAIRIGRLQDSSQYAIHVGDIKRVVCGSPDYFKEHGIPKRPADLANHKIILSTTVEPSTTWKFVSSKKETVKVAPCLHCNQNGAAINAAIQGGGITRLMSYQIGEELESGALKRVLDRYETKLLPVNVVYLEGRQANAKIRSFIDLAVERLRANPFLNKAGR